MRRNNEVGNGLSVDQVALKHATTVSQVIKLACSKGIISAAACEEGSAEDLVRAYMPGSSRQQDHGRPIIRDVAYGEDRGGYHTAYLLNLCGGIRRDEQVSEGVMSFQNVLPLAGGSGALKFTVENGQVTGAEQFLESRF